jgi:hypothetical protein
MMSPPEGTSPVIAMLQSRAEVEDSQVGLGLARRERVADAAERPRDRGRNRTDLSSVVVELRISWYPGPSTLRVSDDGGLRDTNGTFDTGRGDTVITADQSGRGDACPRRLPPHQPG